MVIVYFYSIRSNQASCTENMGCNNSYLLFEKKKGYIGMDKPTGNAKTILRFNKSLALYLNQMKYPLSVNYTGIR